MEIELKKTNCCHYDSYYDFLLVNELYFSYDAKG